MNTNRFLKLTALTLVLCTVMGLFSSCCCFVPAGLTAAIVGLLELPAKSETSGDTSIKPLPSYEESLIVPGCDHKFSSWVTVQEASCETEGLRERSCDLCGYPESEPIAPTGHTFSEATFDAPKTCKACGRTEGKKKDAQNALYNLILQNGYSAGTYYFYQTAYPADLGANAAAYLVADTSNRELILFYSYEDISVYLWDLKVGNTGNYTVSGSYGDDVYAQGTLRAASFVSTGGKISDFSCDSSAYTSTMKTVLQSGAAIAVYSAEDALSKTGTGLSLTLFGFTDLNDATVDPVPPVTPEPAETYTTPWFEWLLAGNGKDKYPFVESGFYSVSYPSAAEKSPFEVWPADYEAMIPKENAHFHMCLTLPMYKTEEAYYDISEELFSCKWETYYRALDSTDAFKYALGNPWSAVPLGEDVIYRYNLMDHGMEKPDLGESYEMFVFIRDAQGKLIGWTYCAFEWTDSAEAYYEMAKKHGVVDSGSCPHYWVAPSCEQPETCTLCAATRGSELGHNWKDAIYTAPQTCLRCGATVGDKRDSKRGLYDFVVKNGSFREGYYLLKTADVPKIAPDAATYLAADPNTLQVHLLFLFDGFSFRLHDLKADPTESYYADCTYASVSAHGRIDPATVFLTPEVSDFYCSNTPLSDSMMTLFINSVALSVLYAEEYLKTSDGLNMEFFGFKNLEQGEDDLPPLEPSYTIYDVKNLTNNCSKAQQMSLYNASYSSFEESSPWEFWPYTNNFYAPEELSRFHLCVSMRNSEFSITDGLSNHGNDGNNYLWKVFYRKAGSNSNYNLVECRSWSAYVSEALTVFRLPLLDHGMEKPTGDLEMIFIVCDEHGKELFWFEETAVWNQSSEDFYNDAKYYGYV